MKLLRIISPKKIMVRAQTLTAINLSEIENQESKYLIKSPDMLIL